MAPSIVLSHLDNLEPFYAGELGALSLIGRPAEVLNGRAATSDRDDTAGDHSRKNRSNLERTTIPDSCDRSSHRSQGCRYSSDSSPFVSVR